MPLPPAVGTFTLTADFPPLSPNGTERQGSFTFTPVPPVLVAASGVYLGVENATLSASGTLTKTLVANDALAEAFVWRMDANIQGLPPFSQNISVPASAGTVALGTLLETDVLPSNYVVVIGPRGPQGIQGPPGSGGGVGALAIANNLSDVASVPAARTNLGLGTAATQATGAFDSSGAAAAAQSAAATALSTHEADTTAVHGIANTAALVLTADSRLANARTPTGTASGDLSGSYPGPTVAAVNGVAVSGTAAAGKVLTATSGAAAAWQTPAAGGGGSIKTSTVRITDDNLAGLAVAASWTIVQTSAGTKLQAAIAAAAGDRIRAVARFMYNGGHFLDWVLLDSSGVIAQYSASGTSSPAPEGDPAMYPSTSFKSETGPPMFTVGSGHIDGTGKVTVALAHQGTSTGLVYAHTTYPWLLRLENIGLEPA